MTVRHTSQARYGLTHVNGRAAYPQFSTSQVQPTLLLEGNPHD